MRIQAAEIASTPAFEDRTLRRKEPGAQPVAADHASEPSALKDRLLRYDSIILRLFCAWIFLQCFVYEELPFFRWNLGIGVNVTPDKLAMVAMLLVVAARLTGSGDSPTVSTRAASTLGLISGTFAIVCLISWLVNGGDVGNRSFGNLTRACNLSVLPAFAYFVARRLRYTRPMLRDLLRFFAALGVYLGVTAIAEHYGVAGLVFPKYILDPHVGVQFGRSRGPFANTIGNGAMLLVAYAAFGCIYATLAGLKRLVPLFFIFMIVPAVYFTETRSVWLGFAAVSGTFIAVRTPLRRTGVLVISVLAVAFVLGVGSKFSAFEKTLFARRQNTIDYRFDNYEITWSAFKANPVFGVGYGKLMADWRGYADLRHSRLGEGLSDGNHSTFLGVLAELGIVGAIPFLGMVAWAAIVAFSACRSLVAPQAMFERQFALVAIGALQIFIVLGLTSDLKTSPTVNITAFWFVGVVSSVASSWRASVPAGAAAKKKVVPSPWRSNPLGRRQSA